MAFEEEKREGGFVDEEGADGLAALVGVEVEDAAAVGEGDEVVQAGAIGHADLVLVVLYGAFELEGGLFGGVLV